MSAEAITRSDLETETRVSVLETEVDNIKNNVVKMEDKIDSNYSTLHHRISEMRDDLRSDIDSKHEKVIEKLDTQTKNSSDQHKVIADKIADIYKQRWQIETLFKRLKQNFPLKYFFGDNQNAIEIQIWVSLIIQLIMLVIQRREIGRAHV